MVWVHMDLVEQCNELHEMYGIDCHCLKRDTAA
jgi:hypothetical protein